MSIINKEFILQPEALALKKLGFIEACFATYISEILTFECLGKNRFINDKSSWVAAPTYRQAFKFIRDKFNFHGNCDLIDSGWFYKTSSLKGEYKTEHHILVGNFNSCEEAELACLKKLIELACLLK